jgi:hypothetical protein
MAAVAAMLEARGITSPDRHDLIIATFGERARIAEVGAVERHVETWSGETSVEEVKRMLSTLPEGHNIGLVTVLLGTDCDWDGFPTFVGEQAKRKNFSLATMLTPRTSQEIFNSFFQALGDVATAGTC